ncbi:hypothetical protein B0H16DRAFT_1468913 [Mycena metata]|uniref:Uncharacterized protein n=1 Tax=Mycena metata TaxID=1033252 RepID=A0AAD7MSW0_9AGAR|nr:hypothetical protein B0H16DRAFT_1468913 [Mycena metata]
MCSHRKKFHKESTVQDVLAKLGVGKLRKGPTDSEARAESYAGFRPKEADEQTKAESKKKNSEQLVRVNNVQLIVAGLDATGELRCDKSLDIRELEKRSKFGVVAFETRSADSLEFGIKWSQKQIDKWLREILPLAFEFLDKRYPKDIEGYHWTLVRKHGKQVFVMHRTNTTGQELEEAKGPATRKWMEHAVRVATKHKIPAAVWMGFDDAIEKLMDGQHLASESEDEEDFKRQKSRRKALPKRRAATPLEESSSEASEGEEEDEDEEVTAPLTRRRRSTSSSASVVVKREGLERDLPFIDDDSEVEEVFPQQLALNKGKSVKRSVSPSFERDEPSKKARSASYQSISSDEEDTIRDDHRPIDGAAAAGSILPSESEMKVFEGVYCPWGGILEVFLIAEPFMIIREQICQIGDKFSAETLGKGWKAVYGRRRPPVPVPFMDFARGMTGRDGTPLTGPVPPVKTALTWAPTDPTWNPMATPATTATTSTASASAASGSMSAAVAASDLGGGASTSTPSTSVALGGSSRRARLQAYLPPPPREGLKVPPAANFWG